jgi:hypothetical protein
MAKNFVLNDYVYELFEKAQSYLTEILAMPGVPSLLGGKGSDHPFIRRAAIFLNEAARHWCADQAADGRQASAAA